MSGDNILPENEAHLWFAIPEKHSDKSLVAAYTDLLNDEEHTVLGRFRFSTDGHRYLVSHAMTRLVLSRYGDHAPHEWQFTRNQHGRPEIFVKNARSSICFNLTKTRGLVACIVVNGIKVGIDVENTIRKIKFEDMGKNVFLPEEVTFARSLPQKERKKGFFTLWTLKEAYVKALGMGLSLPLNSFSFSFPPGRNPEIIYPPDSNEDPKKWQFLTLSPTPSHVLSVALKRGNSPDLKVVVKEFCPN